MMKWTTIVIGVLIVTGVSASAQRNADSFASALAEAKRLTDTEAGKKYDEEFAKSASSRVSEVVSECTHHAPQAVFDVIFIFEASGNVKQVLTSPNEPAAVCVGDKLRDLRLPPPPRADWPVVLSINIKPENASTVRALDAKFAADSLKYSRDFYSKVHFVAIADISFNPGGKMQFKYDRYPNGGPERIQVGGGEFARKNGTLGLQSNDGGEQGTTVDAKATPRLPFATMRTAIEQNLSSRNRKKSRSRIPTRKSASAVSKIPLTTPFCFRIFPGRCRSVGATPR